MLRRMKIRFAKIIIGSMFAIAPFLSITACDQSMGQILDILN